MSRGSHAAAWYPDPDEPEIERYWDGERWTGRRRPMPPPPVDEPAPGPRVPAEGSGFATSAGATGLANAQRLMTSWSSTQRMLLIGAVLATIGSLLPWAVIEDRFSGQRVMNLNGFTAFEVPDPTMGMVRQGFGGGLFAGWIVLAAGIALAWVAFNGGQKRHWQIAFGLVVFAASLLLLQGPFFLLLESNLQGFGALPLPRFGGFLSLVGVAVGALGLWRSRGAPEAAAADATDRPDSVTEPPSTGRAAPPAPESGRMPSPDEAPSPPRPVWESAAPPDPEQRRH